MFFLADPPPTQYDLRFSLFGVPVRVHPVFWLTGLLLGIGIQPAESDHFDFAILLAWMAAFFLSILIHEMGHALVMRSYGYMPWVTLHGLGGMASYNPGQARTPGLWGRVAISFAGPGAGFLIVGLITMAFIAAGKPVRVDLAYYVIPEITVGYLGSVYLTLFILFFLHITVVWGFLNLLPIYPLDGGQISRELFAYYRPRDGVRVALMLSFAVAGLMAVMGFVNQNWFSAIFFGYLAYQSYAMLAMYGGIGPRW